MTCAALPTVDPAILAKATPAEIARLNYLLRIGERYTLSLVDWAVRFLRHRLKTYNPDSPTLGMSAFQRSLCTTLDSMQNRRGVRHCEMAPRKNAKSSYATIAHPLRESLEGREPYTMILSDALDKNAIPFLRDNIKKEIEDNAALKAAYPTACRRGRIWQDDKIELGNGCLIEVSSTGQNVRGRLHNGNPPSLVICDDLQGPDDVASPTKRNRDWAWFNADVLNIGNPDTNFFVLGTAGHRDFICYKLQKTPGWKTRLWRALGGEQKPDEDKFSHIAHLKNPALWDQWEYILHDNRPGSDERALEFFEQHRAAMEDDLARFVLWPEQYPFYDLMLRMVTIGPAAFASEQQNDPNDPSALEWPADYFDDIARPELRFDEWNMPLAGRVLYLDPAKGTKNRPGDFACWMRFGWGASPEPGKPGREYYEADLFRGSQEATQTAIVERGIRHVREFKPVAVGFEDSGQQHLYGQILERAFAEAGLEYLVWPMSDMTDKLVRIRRLEYPLAKRLASFRRTKGTDMLLEQLRDFPTHERFDGPDAMDGARRTGKDLMAGRGRGASEGQRQYRT